MCGYSEPHSCVISRWGTVRADAAAQQEGKVVSIDKFSTKGGLAAAAADYAIQVDLSRFKDTFESSEDDDEETMDTLENGASGGVVSFNDSCGSTLWRCDESMFSYRMLGDGEQGVSSLAN